MPTGLGGKKSKKEPASGRGPLAGLRIVAVEQFGAGPLGTLYLADLGADVIKVEDPTAGGDVGRYVPPHVEQGASLYFESFNRGKRSIVLDLKTDSGRQVFLDLVETADAVYSNLRGDLAGELGLTYESLGSVNPRVVCVALSGYGRDGERAHLPAYDALIQAEVGWSSITGEPDGPPTKSGLSLVDYIGGLTSALGLLAKVMDARLTGRGGDVDVDLYRSSLSMYAYQATWLLTRGTRSERQPMSAHASIVPFQFFETMDGHVAIACAKEKFYAQLADVLDLGQVLGRDSKDFSARRANRKQVLHIIGNRLRQQPTRFWVDTLKGKVPVAAVRSMEQALEPDELRELGMLATYHSQVFGEVRSIGSPIRVAGFEPRFRSAPALGADKDVLLDELGISATTRRSLERKGAFGAPAES